MKKRKLRNTRPEAFWGAVIGAAASLLGSAISSKGASDSASSSADAIIQASRENARALQQQNENNNRLQQQSQDFIKAENERNRQIQRDLQMSMQLQGGQLSADERRMASRIQVKKGGKVSRKKLRDAFFYGGGNLPFRVTDGGGVLPLGQTLEGYDLYEIVGNDHNHYHKTRSGKYKTGVGIAFDSPDYGNGRLMQAKGGKATEVVEGEGNQNTNQGEYLLVTPDSGMFISKHSINGFNPVQAVNAGMHPLMAYNVQEASKGTSPVRKNRHKALAGVSTNYIYPTEYPSTDINFDMAGVNSNLRRSLRRGGRVKAVNGNITGGWITGLGNIGAGLISGFGSWYGNRKLANAYPIAAKYLSDAYDNLRTVDISGIRRDMFGNQHYMPVVRSTTYNVNDQLGDVNRAARTSMKAVNTNTLSSAARLSRMSGINDSVVAARSKIYADKFNKEESIRQKNIDALNEAAKQNVLMDVDASKDFTRTYVDLLKYNNDIVNEGISGKAQALADSVLGAAQARAAGIQGLTSNIGSGLAAGVGAIGSGYAAAAQEKRDMDKVLWGGDLENRVRWVAQSNDPNQKASVLTELQADYNAAIDPAAKAKYAHLISILGGSVTQNAPAKPVQASPIVTERSPIDKQLIWTDYINAFRDAMYPVVKPYTNW